MSRQIALAIVLGLGASSFAINVVRAETAEEQQACTNDAFQFCQNAIPDRDRVFNCLMTNRSQISPACRSAMAPYLPVEAKHQASAPSPVRQKTAEKTTKLKGPLNITPH
jgi:hypothetical protein